jgi:hypothetical protein
MSRTKTVASLLQALEQFGKQHGVDSKKSILVAGGAAYMRGMRPDINDVDFIHHDLPGFIKQKSGRFEMDGGPGRDLPPEALEYEVIDGVRVQTPKAMLAFYRALNRPKDQEKIKTLSQLVEVQRRQKNLKK